MFRFQPCLDSLFIFNVRTRQICFPPLRVILFVTFLFFISYKVAGFESLSPHELNWMTAMRFLPLSCLDIFPAACSFGLFSSKHWVTSVPHLPLLAASNIYVREAAPEVSLLFSCVLQTTGRGQLDEMDQVSLCFAN